MLLGGACAHEPSEPRSARAHAAIDPRFIERERPAYAPTPGTTDRSADLALRAQSAGDAARETALGMVQALLNADAAALQALFADRVVFGLDGSGRPRAEIVERCLEETRALAYEPDLHPDDVVDIGAIEVRRAEQAHERSALPPGIEPGDLLVTLPPRDHGLRARAHARSRMACVGGLYVRVGARAQIVGMLR